MARSPGHQIELTEGGHSELAHIPRAAKLPWQEVQPARIVLYAAEGCTTPRWPLGRTRRRGLLGSGEHGMPWIGSRGCSIRSASSRPASFSPRAGFAAFKAVARELPIRCRLRVDGADATSFTGR